MKNTATYVQRKVIRYTFFSCIPCSFPLRLAIQAFQVCFSPMKGLEAGFSFAAFKLLSYLHPFLLSIKFLKYWYFCACKFCERRNQEDMYPNTAPEDTITIQPVLDEGKEGSTKVLWVSGVIGSIFLDKNLQLLFCYRWSKRMAVCFMMVGQKVLCFCVTGIHE